MGKIKERPLRLEELKSGADYWLEDKGQGIMGGKLVFDEGLWWLRFEGMTGPLRVRRDPALYGKRWRCWDHEAPHRTREKYDWAD